MSETERDKTNQNKLLAEYLDEIQKMKRAEASGTQGWKNSRDRDTPRPSTSSRSTQKQKIAKLKNLIWRVLIGF